MPINNTDKNSIIAVNIKNPNNTLFFNNRMLATTNGFNTSKIGTSLKNYRYSYKGYFWFYSNLATKENIEYRFKIYKMDYRKTSCKLFKKCNTCKIVKSWKEFRLNRQKSNKINKCNDCSCKMVCKYQKNNRTFINQKRKSRLDNNLLFKLRINCSNRIRNVINSNYTKNTKSSELLGCTYGELKKHIEGHFTSTMSWDNYGFYGWHIDHIIPLSSAKNKEELYKLCHYSNLQPLWAVDNLRKGNKIPNEVYR